MSRADILDVKARIEQMASGKHLGQEDKGCRARVTVTSGERNDLV